MTETAYLTLKEAAAKMRKSERWLWRWLDKNPVDEQGLPYCRRLGRTPLFHDAAMARLKRAIDDLDRRPTFIYFIEIERHIKIGIASNWRKRLSTLQTGSPFPIKTLLVLSVHVGFEAELHRQFESYHVRGEWFRDCPEIRAFIARAWRSRLAIELPTDMGTPA